MSLFWSWPFWRSVHFDNSVSQARDLQAAERNFLTGVRTAFTVAVASGTIVFQSGGFHGAGWPDWTLGAVLLVVAISLPVTSLLNYATHFDAHYHEEAEIHNSSWLLLTLLVTSVASVLVAIREYTR